MRQLNWILTGLLLISYPLSKYLPQAWGRENALFEWFQVIILLAGMGLSIMHMQTARRSHNYDLMHLYAAAVPVWAMMAGRELSWGRALFTGGSGKLIPLDELQYGWLVHLILAIIFAIWLFFVFRYKIYQVVYNILRSRCLPDVSLIVTLAAILLTVYAENFLHNQLLEELAELVLYTSLVNTVELIFSKQYHVKGNTIDTNIIAK